MAGYRPPVTDPLGMRPSVRAYWHRCARPTRSSHQLRRDASMSSRSSPSPSSASSCARGISTPSRRRRIPTNSRLATTRRASSSPAVTSTAPRTPPPSAPSASTSAPRSSTPPSRRLRFSARPRGQSACPAPSPAPSRSRPSTPSHGSSSSTARRASSPLRRLPSPRGTCSSVGARVRRRSSPLR